MSAASSATALNLLSAGAAQGLVLRLQAEFEHAHNARLLARFGAVGAMQELLAAGEPCDVMVLTQALVEKLAGEGRMVATSITPLGRVFTGVAVREGAALPDVASDEGLRAALLGCDALYVPDTLRSTAGQHVRRVLQALGLQEAMADKLNEHPNGATAMRTMAASASARSLGITQLSEIMATPGVVAVARLPQAHELATTYSAALSTSAAKPQLAQALIATLSSPQAAPLRVACGIEP